MLLISKKYIKYITTNKMSGEVYDEIEIEDLDFEA